LDQQVTNLDNLWTLATPSYSDQVLPFNVTLTGANEYGAMTCGKILGIEILNEGSGISVDDSVSEAQATFVARAVEPMQAVQSNFISTVGGNNQVPSSCRTTKASRVARGGTAACPRNTRCTPAGCTGETEYFNWAELVYSGWAADTIPGLAGIYIYRQRGLLLCRESWFIYLVSFCR
jgi:hypothetical protein